MYYSTCSRCNTARLECPHFMACILVVTVEPVVQSSLCESYLQFCTILLPCDMTLSVLTYSAMKTAVSWEYFCLGHGQSVRSYFSGWSFFSHTFFIGQAECISSRKPSRFEVLPLHTVSMCASLSSVFFSLCCFCTACCIHSMIYSDRNYIENVDCELTITVSNVSPIPFWKKIPTILPSKQWQERTTEVHTSVLGQGTHIVSVNISVNLYLWMLSIRVMSL